MRVCFLNPPIEFYSPISGGAIATILMQSAKQLIKHGHAVTILTPVNKDEVYQVGTVIKVASPTRDELPALSRKMASLRSQKEGWDWPNYLYYLNSFTAALKAMKPQPDIVIAFNDLVSPKYIRDAAPGARTVVWLQNEQGTKQKSLQKAFAAIDKILTCSAYIRDYTVGRYSIPQDKFSVVHSGVDLEAFSPKADYLDQHTPLRTLFIGRIDPNKGPDIAADAVAAIRKEDMAISLTVAGGLWFYGHGNEMNDPFFRTLKEKMDAVDANYLGYVTRTRVPEVVRGHDVAFVLSRSNEPFGLVSLEAMASGCAVIASNRGGLPEACGGAAMLVDPDKPDEVVKLLRKLARDSDLLNVWKQRSIAHASRASWDLVGDKLNSVLGLLL
jgi:glycosyltransferase involved in cell wall biosynthesis